MDLKEDKFKKFLTQGKSVKEGVTEQDVDKKQLSMGKKIELEHTSDTGTATRIALDHLAEFPTYYTALGKMEESLKKQSELTNIKDHVDPVAIVEKTPDVKSDTEKSKPIVAAARLIASRNKMATAEKIIYGQVMDVIKQSSARSIPQEIMEKIAKRSRHPVSESQRRWAFAAEEKGDLPKGKALAWSRRVKGEDLPEKTAAFNKIVEDAFKDELKKLLP